MAEHSKAVVGPLPTVDFRGDPRPQGWGHDRTRIVADPPRNTGDPRYTACEDHHTACDCREAELSEEISEYRGLRDEALAAVAEVLAGHRTWPDTYRPVGDDYAAHVYWVGLGSERAQLILDAAELDEGACCSCTGCAIARKAWLR